MTYRPIVERIISPAPAEMAAALAEIRAEGLARQAQREAAPTKAQRRRERLAKLPALVREAVMAATALSWDSDEGWKEED
jgi:hypothetical protein